MRQPREPTVKVYVHIGALQMRASRVELFFKPDNLTPVKKN